MTRRKAILIFGMLALLGVGLLAYGALSGDRENPRAPQSEAEKLAKLKAALIEAAATGKAKQADCDTPKQLPPPRPSRTRST